MNQRALVLGGGGFLGSHLCRRLVTDGWDVVALTRDKNAAHVRVRLEPVLSDLEMVDGDACDERLLRRLVPDVHAVFPFAGQSGAARSLGAPLGDLLANAGGQLAVLEALRHGNREARVVFPGSRLQYGRSLSLPVAEDHPQEPTSHYGLHKLIGERYHHFYAGLYGLRTCCLRISNPYGPGQDRPDRAFGVVGNFLAMAARNEDIPLYGGGGQLRDYVYVDDVVDACVLAATDPRADGKVFNVGGPEATSVREMAESVIRTVGRGRLVDAPWPDAEAAVETGDYVSDLRRIEADLGWSPVVPLEDGLAATWSELELVVARAM